MFKKFLIISAFAILLTSNTQCFAKVFEKVDDFTGNSFAYSTFHNLHNSLFGKYSIIDYNFVVKKENSNVYYLITTYGKDTYRNLEFNKEANIKIGNDIYVLSAIDRKVTEVPNSNGGLFEVTAAYVVPAVVIQKISNLTDYNTSSIATRFICKGLYTSGTGEDCVDDYKVNEENFKDWKQIISKYGLVTINNSSGSQIPIGSQRIETPNQLGDNTLNALLCRAVWLGGIDMNMANDALHRGANPSYTGNFYYTTTPFFEVIYNRNLDAVKMFIAYGADVNMKLYQNNGDSTPLYNAIQGGSFEIVQTLVEAGANINNRLSDGLSGRWTAMVAFSYKDMNNQTNVDMFNYLLSKGADISITDKFGNTLLMSSARQGNYPLTKMYLSLGLNPLKRNNDGKSALDLAIANGNKECINLLLSLTK